MKVLFFHGGPGLNGQPERALLTAPYAEVGLDLRVWDEPSLLRPEGAAFDPTDAFACWLTSADGFLDRHADGDEVLLVGHSFGAWAAWHLARTAPARVRRVVYVNPAVTVSEDHARILRFARDDLERHGEAGRAAELAELLDAATPSFDEVARRSWELALANPRLFDFYWRDREIMARYSSHYEGAYGVDLASFFAVSSTRPSALPEGSSPAPATVVFGEHDAIVSRDLGLALLSARHPRLEVTTIAGAAHYPQVERLEALRDVLLAGA